MLEAICVAIMCSGVTIAIVLMIGQAIGIIDITD